MSWIKNKKEEWRNTLSKLKKKPLSYKGFDFVGFDVETQGRDNTFLMGSFYWYKGQTEKIVTTKVFWNKEEMIQYLYDNLAFFKRRYIVATNLEFDFTVLFKKTKEFNDFDLLYRGNSLVMVKHKNRHKCKKGRLKFIDTFNFLPFSVEKLGKILGNPKLNKPSSWETHLVNGVELMIPRKPVNDFEMKELQDYNVNDSKISCDIMYLLQKGVISLGGTMKITSASSSMDIFRRSFLKIPFIKEEFVLKEDVKPFIFKSYYGGRTEVYKRGEYKDIYYYDINSLYPSVMKKSLPLPQSVKHFLKGTIENINSYMGVSECEVFCPNMDKPLLPFRKEGKLLFPTGSFKGVWTNEELKKAVSLGYKILSVGEQVIYTKSFNPFSDFVDTLYTLRNKQKEKNDPLEIVTKLMLNSLYGKFGMKEITETIIMDLNNMNEEDFKLLDKHKGLFDLENDFVKIIKTKKYNGKCSFPIIASYITSYARLLMYDYINDESVCYTDTDSIMTTKPLDNSLISKDLGFMKLEDFYNKAFFVRPKFYLLEKQEESLVKVKGLSRANKEDFYTLINGGVVGKMKFVKLKESIVQRLEVNSVKVIEKKMNIYDEKRIWINNHVFKSDSLSIVLNEGLNSEEVRKIYDDYSNKVVDFDSEKFDKESVGFDIGNEEFLDNEIYMERFN